MNSSNIILDWLRPSLVMILQISLNVFSLEVTSLFFFICVSTLNFTFIIYLDSLFFFFVFCFIYVVFCSMLWLLSFFLNSVVILNIMLPEWPKDDHIIGRNM